MSRRDKSDRNVKHYLTKTLTEILGKMTLNRANLLAPLPVPVATLYKYLWTDREEAAIRLLLRECPKALDTDWAMYVGQHFNRRLEQKVAYTFTLRHGMPCAGRSVDFSILPEDMQEQLIEWEVQRIKLVGQGKELEAKVKSMSNVCTTYGQVNRLWPELLSFFTSVGQAKIGDAKVKSKLHDDCYIWERVVGETRWDGEAVWKNTGKIKEEWLPAAFARHTELIAECLMLPQAPEDSPEVTVNVVG